MACLALSLQPANGSDILLQTREWFPPARALVVLSAFRQTRLVFSGKQAAGEDPDSALGDDPLAASSGQVIVGVESKYRVVYRLVNGIYVLGITTVDDREDVCVNNVFECISIVNQAVSVVVTACRGVDVTPEKLHRKYAEIYMALDIVLKGVSSIRLAAILSSMHGEGIAKIVHSAIDAENRARGAQAWSGVAEGLTVEHEANVEIFSNARFELPPETMAAGDEVAATLVPQSTALPEQEQPKEKSEESTAEKDPFAASDVINKPQELVGGFKKTKDASANDLSSALAGLEVTTLPPAAATQSTHIGVEGFEGDYGGVEFDNEEATLNEAFEGFNEAFGGGLDASEFVESTKVAKPLGLGGLELLETANSATAEAKAASRASAPLENLLVKQAPEMKGPEMYISEEISVEFRESVLARVGLQGIVYLKTLPPKKADGKETEFSFRCDGTAGIKRCVMQGSHISSLGNGLFYVRTAPTEEPLPILKYSLQPKFTPIPLRVRMVQRYSGTLLSVMVQYASNPQLLAPLRDVTFIVKLPVDPALLKVSPKAILNRSEKELRWHVQDIPLKGPPGCLRARMSVDEDCGEEIECAGLVKFSVQGASTLSGVFIHPVSDDKLDFYLTNHRYENGIYMCS